MVQTPTQRRANEKFAKAEAAKRGRPETTVTKTKTKPKATVSKGWVVLLAFVVCGGMLFELAKVVPEIWTFIASFFARWTN